MILVARGNLLYILTKIAGKIFMSDNLHNLSQGIHFILCVHQNYGIARRANLIAQAKTFRNESIYFLALHTSAFIKIISCCLD